MIAISTAFAQGLIGIKVGDKADFISLEASCKQSENILFSIDKLLDKNEIDINNNEEFAVIVGPGSFTGLRIGIALVKGFCAGLKNTPKVVAISSLDLMAYEYIKKHSPQRDFACVINALSGLYFVCRYSGNGEKLTEERLIDEDELKQIDCDKVCLKDEGLSEKQIELTAEGLLGYALKKADNQEFVDYKTLSPVYLRKSQAEAMLEQKNNKKS